MAWLWALRGIGNRLAVRLQEEAGPGLVGGGFLLRSRQSGAAAPPEGLLPTGPPSPHLPWPAGLLPRAQGGGEEPWALCGVGLGGRALCLWSPEQAPGVWSSWMDLSSGQVPYPSTTSPQGLRPGSGPTHWAYAPHGGSDSPTCQKACSSLHCRLLFQFRTDGALILATLCPVAGHPS